MRHIMHALVCCLFRAIYEWDIVRGKHARVFQYPMTTGTLLNMTTNASQTNLYAVDRDGVLFIWDMTSDAQCSMTSQRQGCEKTSVMPTHSVNVWPVELDAKTRNELIRDKVELYPVDNGVIVKYVSCGYLYHVDLTTTDVTLLSERCHDQVFCLGRYVLRQEPDKPAQQPSGDARRPSGIFGTTSVAFSRITGKKVHIMYDCHTKASETLTEGTTMPAVFGRLRRRVVYHESTSELLVFDGDAEVLHLWNPASQTTRQVDAQVNKRC